MVFTVRLGLGLFFHSRFFMDGTVERSLTHSSSSAARYFYPYWEYMDMNGRWIPFYQPGIPYQLKAAIQLPNGGPVLLLRHPLTLWVDGQQLSAAEDMMMSRVYVVRNSSFPPPFLCTDGHEWYVQILNDY
jgi:hypothetical protein